ncbi:MAG: hypothetical protein NT087_13735 [Deltaproteobacteria bacterium]|nr:hypothetical protein [Deltaproteobacteria bacterium]
MDLSPIKTIKARLQATWFWQVFGVCAMQKTWTKFLVAAIIVSGYVVVMAGLELLTPIYSLEEMNRTEGVLVVAQQPLRNIYGSKVIIRKDDGEKAFYRGAIRDSEDIILKAAIGKQVTVWSQIEYSVRPPFVYERFWHIQEGEKILYDYDSWLPGRLFGRAQKSPALFKFSLFMFIVLLVIVVSACRNPVKS